MYTIKNNYQFELIIKNSKFICLLYKINSLSDIDKRFSEEKEKYPNATHYCYAYILNNISKCSDDGEPAKTAGYPILKVLENNKIDYVLAIVVRYFGGIKLGANGLIRAYSKCVTNALKESTLTELIDGYNVNISFNYQDIKQVDYLLKNSQMITKEFNNTVIYNANIEDLSILKDNNLKYEIIKPIKIEK